MKGCAMVSRYLGVLLAAIAAPAVASLVFPLTVQEARAGLAGNWTGKLEYRDYRADRWFGLPVTVSIETMGDGLTLIRKAAFDDGPRVGTVHVTTVAILDPSTNREQVASFRKGRSVEPTTSQLRFTDALGPRTWTMVEERTGTDDDRPARLRETTTRNGDTLVTIKEVDFTEDTKAEWLVRNRTTLSRR
jgi:hypothetical protein